MLRPTALAPFQKLWLYNAISTPLHSVSLLGAPIHPDGIDDALKNISKDDQHWQPHCHALLLLLLDAEGNLSDARGISLQGRRILGTIDETLRKTASQGSNTSLGDDAWT